MAAISPTSRIAVHLDDGVDSAELQEHDLSLSRRGMLMRSRWRFPIGTQLSISIDAGSRHRMEGIVVECEPDGPRMFQTTVLFLDAPEDLELLERSDVGALLAF